jgi:asparagine synthase (glutamine-hydrolysing)
MSAFFGIWNLDGRAVESDFLRRASHSLIQRGPDSQTTYAKDSFGMVYCAFHVTEDSRQAVQPHVSQAGLIAAWNGRLDNRDELINYLGPAGLGGSADVVLAGMSFEKWGDRSFTKLIGDWALSVWHPSRKTLVLARDYIGIRHLYYYVGPRRVMWSTHLEPLVLLSDHPLSLNEEYLADYLAHVPAADLTPYRQIHAVPPGNFVTISNGRATSSPYWRFDSASRIRYQADADYEDHFRQLFRQAVARRLRSRSPVLAELSGGIDSSSIVCMADDIIEKGDVGTARLDTLSAFDPEDPNGDEQIYITKIESKRGRAGHHLNREDYENVFNLEWDDLVAVPGAVEPTGKLRDNLLAIVQSGGYRAVLSGIGGDEFLGGIPNPLPQLGDLIILLRPIQLAKELTAWSLLKKRPCIHLLGQTLATLLPARLRALASTHNDVAPWIASDFSRRYSLALRQLGPLGRFGFWLPTRRDAAQSVVAMARQMSYLPTDGLACEERRYPFLDQSLVEFLLAIPARQLLRPGQRRSLMRRALGEIVPAEVLWRKTKGFVTKRVLAAFDNNWPELEVLFNTPLSGELKYVDAALFLAHLRAAKNGEVRHLMYLLKTLYLEAWLRNVVDRGLLDVSSMSQTRTHQPVFKSQAGSVS